MTAPVVHFVRKADVVLGIGCSLTKHVQAISIPPGKKVIHATNDPRDLNKNTTANIPRRTIPDSFVASAKTKESVAITRSPVLGF